MKKINQFSRLHLSILIVCIQFIIFSACQEKQDYYTAGDFEKAPKTDAHFHYNSTSVQYFELATGLNFRLLSPNVDSRISIDKQLYTASALRQAYPGKFSFFGTFSVDSFGTKGFAENTIARIAVCMKAGASGIKIWKNIGMVLKDTNGSYVMADDPGFDPVFKYIIENKIPVLGHLGEPKNCWLPFEEMTDTSNYRYYKANPQYHMYMHPEAPTYDDQINAMDNLLKKNPGLDYTGAHLASLEWNIDEVAKRLDMFPNFKVEFSARIARLQSQSIADYDRVRDFMIKYQDRILYGTDVSIPEEEPDFESKSHALAEKWRSNWLYLATDSVQKIKNLPDNVKGLHLPRSVVDKIFHTNTDRFFRPV